MNANEKKAVEFALVIKKVSTLIRKFTNQSVFHSTAAVAPESLLIYNQWNHDLFKITDNVSSNVYTAHIRIHKMNANFT